MSTFSSQGVDLSVVLSFRNEELVLPELIARLQAVFSGLKLNHEILFINDASQDGSLEILKRFAVQDKRIKVITLSRRFGVQASILAGIQHASGNAVIMMDADLQDPPELIPQMVEKWRAGAEIVHMVRSEREGEHWLKMSLTRWAYQCMAWLSDVSFPVEAGDFKLLSRRTVSELLRHPEQVLYLRGLIASLGFEQISLFYRREKRYAGSSHFSLLGRGPLETFFAGVTSFSPLPLFAIFVIGLSLTFLALFIFLILLSLSLLGLGHSGMWIGNFLFLLFSFNISSVGLLGLYVWNVLKQTQKRPLYLVEEKVNFE